VGKGIGKGEKIIKKIYIILIPRQVLIELTDVGAACIV
jgi:hypothetical protein